MIKIYVEDNSEIRQYEANMKQFRYDVYAEKTSFPIDKLERIY